MLIPWDQGERISFAVTVLLSIIVFLLILSENLPKTDTQTLLSKMLIGLTIFSLMVVFLTVLIGFMHSYKDKKIHFIKNIYRFFTCKKPKNCMKEDNDSDRSSVSSVTSDSYSIQETIINALPFRTQDYSLTSNIRPFNSPNNSCNTEDIKKINSNLEKIIKNTNSSEEESEYERCNLIAEYIERFLTFCFVSSFIIFCAILFSERPEY